MATPATLNPDYDPNIQLCKECNRLGNGWYGVSLGTLLVAHSAYRFFREGARLSAAVELGIGLSGIGAGALYVGQWDQLGCAKWYDNSKKYPCMPNQFKQW